MGKNGLNAHADEILSLLFSLLGSRQVKKKVKPHIIYCLGDLGWALGSSCAAQFPKFAKHFRIVAKNIMVAIKRYRAGEKKDMKFTRDMMESLLVALSCVTQAVTTTPGELIWVLLINVYRRYPFRTYRLDFQIFDVYKSSLQSVKTPIIGKFSCRLGEVRVNLFCDS